jgi:hypothetical protein
MARAVLAALVSMCLVCPALSQSDIAKQVDIAKETRSISTPNALNTRIGPLQFNDGRPVPKTVEQLYEHLDFVRGVDVFLNAMPGASLVAMRRAQRSMGAADNSFVMFEHYLDSKTLALTGNTESLFASGFLDVTDGPLVLEFPPNVLGVLDDIWFRHIADYGITGPDKGKGGKLLIVAPAYKGRVPSGFQVARSRTNAVWAVTRGVAQGGDVSSAAMQLLSRLKVYPLAQAHNPPTTELVNGSGNAVNTVHANDFSFYEDIDSLVQAEPADALDPELTGQLAAIGIVKGKPFSPDARMKRALADAATVGSATARAILFRPRDPAAYLYPDSAWMTPLMGGGTQFMRNADDGSDGAGCRFAVRVRSGRCARRVAGRRQALPSSTAAERTGQGGLVGHAVRSADPLAVADRKPAACPRQSERQAQAECRRHHRSLVRPEGADQPGRQLCADGARQGLVRGPACPRAAQALVRQKLAAR